MSVTKGVGGKGWRCSAILNVNNLCQFLLIFCCLQEIHVRCWVMFPADPSHCTTAMACLGDTQKNINSKLSSFTFILRDQRAELWIKMWT